MKKIILLIMAIFPFAIAEATESSRTITNCINSEKTVNAPVYWSGWAEYKGDNDYRKLYIKVYRSADMCDSFYAVTIKLEKHWSDWGSPKRKVEELVPEELVVRESGSNRYYVRYDGKNYYFNM